MAESGIQILVSNTGGASPSGESANKIRDNLQQAFSRSPVNVKIQASTASLRGIRDSIIKELANLNIDVSANVKTNGVVRKRNAIGATGRQDDWTVGTSVQRRIARERNLEKAQAKAINRDQEQSWRKQEKDHIALLERIAKADSVHRKRRHSEEVAQAKAINKAQEHVWKQREKDEVAVQTHLASIDTKRHQEELAAEEAQAHAINKVQEQAWKQREKDELAVRDRLANADAIRRHEELSAEEAQAKAINRAQELAYLEAEQKATRDKSTNKRTSKAFVTSIEKVNFDKIDRNKEYIQSIHDELIEDAKQFANRNDQIGDQELIEFEKRINAFKNLVKMYKDIAVSDSTHDYVEKTTARFNSQVKNMLDDVALINDPDKQKALLDQLAIMEDDVRRGLEDIGKTSGKISPQVKQNIIDIVTAMHKLVSEAKKAQRISDAENNRKKRAEDTTKEANARWAANRRYDAKQNFEYLQTHVDAEQYKEAHELLLKINSALDEYAVSRKELSVEQQRDIITWIKQLGQLDATARQAGEDLIATDKSRSQAQIGAARFEEYLRTLKPRALTEMAGQIEKIRQLFQKGTPAAIKEANDALKAFKADMKMLGYEGGNMLTYISEKMKTFFTYLVSSTITMNLTNMLGKIVTNVKELDKAMTDLRIVTGDTKEETKDLIQSYNAMAQSLGTTTTSVAAGATDWLRQGYDAVESAELLRQSMTLSIVGAMESEDATNALTAAMKGYQLSVEEASDVVDKFFKVDMSAATSSSDLALALAKTAANAKLAGLSLDDVVGQLAVVNETMKESGEETGSFYNTMLSRMGNIKAGRVDDIETGEDLSDVESTLKQMGVALRDSTGQFRNFGEVLNEVGTQWDRYDNVQQRAIATAFAGRMCA